MDELDRKIVNILMKDSRTPFVRIAKDAGISEGTVRRRVQKLIKDGTIKKFTIVTGPIREITAFVLVTAVPQAQTPEVTNEMKEIANVQEVYEVSGEYDIIAFVRGNTINEINKGVDQIRMIDGVAKTITVFVLK
jgi:DNA-binding Lrp family transcriptional regulator